MQFIATSHFSRARKKTLSEGEYFDLQLVLAQNPNSGDVIEHGHGLRKIRVKVAGRGKSGGPRVIYYYKVSQEIILLLDIYKKNEKENLTRAELKKLSQIAKEMLP